MFLRRHAFRAVALPLLLAAVPSHGETYWSAEGAGLSAFHLDPGTGALNMTMQMAGGSLSRYPYLGIATNPWTGELWATYDDTEQQRQAIGRLRPGSLRPDPDFVLPPRYQFELPHPTFTASSTMYLQLFDLFEEKTLLAKLDTSSGLLEPVLELWQGHLTGIAFRLGSEKLHLSGLEGCDTVCVPFLDTLTIPDHQRSRLSAGTSAGELVFTGVGDLLLLDFFVQRWDGESFVSYAFPPYFRSPFGSIFKDIEHASRADGTLQGCFPSLTRACLQFRRFSLDVTFDASAHGGAVGPARPLLESDESVKFYFFTPENLEVFVKVLDGCGYNDHYWIFASGLTDLGVSLSVSDARTGQIYTHDNPPGQVFAPLLDITAFPCVD
jgi:hypothetical protein